MLKKKKKNHISKWLQSLLQDAAHFKLKTEQNLEAHHLYFTVGGKGEQSHIDI